MALTLVEQSLMFRRRNPMTLFAVCLGHVRLSVIVSVSTCAGCF